MLLFVRFIIYCSHMYILDKFDCNCVYTIVCISGYITIEQNYLYFYLI